MSVSILNVCVVSYRVTKLMPGKGDLEQRLGRGKEIK